MTWRLDNENEQPAPQGRWRIERTGIPEAFASSAADTVTFGAGDEIAGGLEYARSRLGGAGHEEAGGQYRRRVREARDRLRRAREDRPVTAFLGSVAGSLVPGAGAARVARTAFRAGLGPIGRTVAAGVSNAAGGALYGAGAANDEQDRVGAAAEGALGGALFGAAFEGAGTLAGTAWRRARGTERQARGAALDRVNSLVRERGETLDGLERRLAAEEASPLADRGQTLGEFIGQPGREELMTLARMPGQTGPRLVDQIQGRQRGQMDRILEDVRGAIGPRPPLAQARRAIRDEYTDVSRTGYRPVLSQSVNPEVFAQRVEPILQDEIFQQAMMRAARSSQREGRRLARAGEEASPINLTRGEDGTWSFAGTPDARTLNAVKQGLDSSIVAAMRRTDADALAPAELRDLTLLKRDLVDALDEAIPGYRDVRARWGSVAEAEEAMEMGRRALAPDARPEDLEEFVAELTPFQRQYFRAGLGDAIETTLARADRDGRRNLADRLGSTWSRRQLRAAFDDDAAFERFASALDEEGAMHATGRRMNPNIGTQTSNVLLRAEDLSSGIPSRGEITQRLLGAGVTRALQGKRDEIGDILTTPVRSARGRMTQAEMAERVRRRRQMTSDAVRNAFIADAGAGAWSESGF